MDGFILRDASAIATRTTKMPFRSKAQWRKFFADPKLRKHAKKWAEHTKRSFKKLPKRKGRKGNKGRK